MTISRIIITNVLDQGCGFAVRVGGGESVFVPISCGPLTTDQCGAEVVAKLVPNGRGNAPFKAQYLDWEERVLPTPEGATVPPELLADLGLLSVEPGKLEGEIMRILHEAEGPVATAEIVAKAAAVFGASEIGPKEHSRIREALNDLWASGSVARAEVRKKAKSEVPYFVCWATSPKILVEFLKGEE